MGGGQLRPAPRDRPGLEPTHLRTLEEDRRRLLAGQRQKMNPTSSRQKKMAGGMNPPETRATLIALVAEDAHAATAAASRVGGDAVPFVRHHLYQVGRCEAAFEIPIGRTFPGQRAGAGWGFIEDHAYARATLLRAEVAALEGLAREEIRAGAVVFPDRLRQTRQPASSPAMRLGVMMMPAVIGCRPRGTPRSSR